MACSPLTSRRDMKSCEISVNEHVFRHKVCTRYDTGYVKKRTSVVVVTVHNLLNRIKQ